MFARKRKREVDSELIDVYDSLANDDESTRLRAANALMTRISNENAVDEALLHKALTRLIRGLSSGRKSARIGFSIALTEILRIYGTASDGHASSLNIEQIIDDLEAYTQIGEDQAGQEIRDHYLGRLFGAAAFVQSGVLFSDHAVSTTWERILDFIFSIAKKKPWLREECGWVLYGATTTLHGLRRDDVYIRSMIERLVADGLGRSPEGIAIWISVKRHFPDIDLPGSIFHNKDPLHKKERGNLARTLRETTNASTPSESDEQQNSATIGYWNPKLNFAWQVVFDELARRRGEEDSISFKELWREAVEDGLFSMKSSHERKYWGLQLFQHFARHGDEKTMAAIFGPNLMRCLANQVSIDDRFLFAAATQCIEALQKRASEDKHVIHAVVASIFEHNVSFDRVSRTKLVEKLLAEADVDNLQLLVAAIGEMLEQRANHPKESLSQQDMQSLADYLVGIVRTHDVPSRDPEQGTYRSTVNMALRYLADTAFLHLQGNEASTLIKARIMTCLNHIITKDVHDPAYHPYYALEAIKINAGIDGDEVVLATVARGHSTLDRIVQESNASGNKDILQTFKLLFTFALIQAYYGDTDAINVVNELQECFESFQKRQVDSEGVVVLVEVIIDFVSRQSALYRRLAPKALASITDRITEEGLDRLVDVLTTKESIQGQDQLFSTEDEEKMDIDMMDGADDASDATSTSSDGSDASGDSGDSREEPDTDTEAEELAQLDAKLAEALGTRRGDDDVALSAPESSDSDMDDEQMEGLDSQLGDIFKQRMSKGNAKSDRKRARDTIVNFKTKILELLEVYIKQEHRNPRALHLVAPVLASMKATSSNQISQKTCDLIRQFSKLYKVKKSDEVSSNDTQAAAKQLLEDVHEFIGQSQSHLQAKSCSSASLLVVKAMLSYGADIKAAAETYDKTLESLETTGQYKFRQCFLEDWRNWQAQAARTGII